MKKSNWTKRYFCPYYNKCKSIKKIFTNLFPFFQTQFFFSIKTRHTHIKTPDLKQDLYFLYLIYSCKY
jgi:hypothetical protein